MSLKILQNQRVRGYLFALTATLAMSNVYIFSKAALKEVHITQFGFYWFGMAIVWNLLFFIKTKKLGSLTVMFSKEHRPLIIIGFIEIVATSSFFSSIHIMENPAVVSFLKNMEPIFVTLLGAIILKERFQRVELIGIFLTLAGAFVISYRGGPLSGFFMKGPVFVLVATIFFSIRTIIAKQQVYKVGPAILSINRLVYLFIFSCVMLLVFRQSILVPKTALLNLAIGSLLGPFLTSISAYSALRYIEASRTALIQSTTGPFVLAGAYLYFNTFPLKHQLLGGVLTIIGFILITIAKSEKDQ